MTTQVSPVEATIRPLRPADVDAAVELLVLAAGADKRHRLSDRLTNPGPGEIHHALVAERSGAVVGAAKLTTEPAFPGTVSALVAVAERERGGGIGTALADALGSWAEREVDPAIVITSAIRDDLDGGRRFARRYGLAVTRHSVGWRFDLPGREDELVRRAADTADAANVRVRVADLATEETLIVECIGRTLPGLPVPGAENQEVDLAHARSVIPDAATVLLAVPEGAPAQPPCGITVVTPLAGSGDWYTVYTGVAVAHRGRGVAAALKAAALWAAYRAGATAVTTHNDDTNEPILRANRAFGMRPSVGYWSLTREG
ncbi:GNAT family N-acetyltransferase [Micromonospora krabiensis]|uniref:Acetyltransferase (GNAT) family protein n=1 Tax=Micromonospora krabiensis TaxID=307121 RepID=A0A1C3N312_9ACTN|nr:GNAT family N-acetyltransferase [Micromonospora krabiensis]SBV26970.1 Acetyltransferase (GNAT) family protein [Micromonospora krabiensis]